MGVETKAQREEVTGTGSHGYLAAAAGFEFGSDPLSRVLLGEER